MLTKADKTALISAIKKVDVKKMEIEDQPENITKWFRFGSYNGLKIATEIILQMPEKKEKVS